VKNKMRVPLMLKEKCKKLLQIFNCFLPVPAASGFEQSKFERRVC
jgi:hypothetical protein